MDDRTSSQDYETGLRLWRDWTTMWNGEPELARDLVGATFRLHAPPSPAFDPRTVASAEDVVRWVAGHRAKFERVVYTTDTGPFVDVRAGVVAGPWRAELVVAGKTTEVAGMDTFVFRDGRIVEYWTLSKESEESAEAWAVGEARGAR